MRPKNKQLSEKYKSFRLQPDAFYGSRLIQTLLNKFIKRGKKAVARRHMYKALTYYRMAVRRPQMFWSLIQMLRRLRIQFLLIPRRQARKYINVPFPVRRNKRDVLNLQTIYKSVTARRERTLSERIQLELLAVTLTPRQSTTLRARNAHLAQVYEERVYMDRRWK